MYKYCQIVHFLRLGRSHIYFDPLHSREIVYCVAIAYTKLLIYKPTTMDTVTGRPTCPSQISVKSRGKAIESQVNKQG